MAASAPAVPAPDRTGPCAGSSRAGPGETGQVGQVPGGGDAVTGRRAPGARRGTFLSGRWRAAPAAPPDACPGRVAGVIEFVRNVRLWFVPEDVRQEGATPDYRFSLANERTFLAWLRTALALIGGGFAVDQFLPDLRWGWRVGLALALLAAGVLCALRAVNHWVRCERAMRRGEDLPVSRFPALLGLVVAVVAVAMVVVVLVGWEG